MISFRSLFLALTLASAALADAEQDDLFKSREEFISTCPVETIETFMLTNADVANDKLEDPLKACQNLQTNCCSRQTFSQGYHQFDTRLRKPIEEELNNFKSLQEKLYRLSLWKLKKSFNTLKEGDKADCLTAYKGDIIDDIHNIKMQRDSLRNELIDVYNTRLRHYSGIICAACNSQHRRSLIKASGEDIESNNLIAVLDRKVCNATLDNHIKTIDIVKALYPLFYFRNMLQCIYEDKPNNIYDTLKLEDLEDDKNELTHCNLPENTGSAECQQLCLRHINLIEYNDKYRLLDYVKETKSVLDKYVDSDLKEINRQLDIDNGVEEDIDDDRSSWTIFNRNDRAGYHFRNIKIAFSHKKAIDLTKDLMDFDYYKFASVPIAIAVALIGLLA